MPQPRIVLVYVPNEDLAEFNTNRQISETRSLHFEWPIHEVSEEKLQSLGTVGRRIVELVLGLEGVTDITISRLQITVTKGEAVDWTDLEEPILEILKETFGEDKDLVEVHVQKLFLNPKLNQLSIRKPNKKETGIHFPGDRPHYTKKDFEEKK